MRENYSQLLDDLNDVFIEDIAMARGFLNDDKTPDIEYTQKIEPDNKHDPRGDWCDGGYRSTDKSDGGELVPPTT